MAKYKIRGGRPIGGKLVASGNKNSALPCLVATLLTDEPVTLSNVPDIEDVRVLLSLLEKIGSRIKRVDKETYQIQTGDLRSTDLDSEACASIRASILLIGPLLARTGSVSLPPPGGDIIGRRRIDTHILAMEGLQATFTMDERLHFQAKGSLQGGDLFLDEASVTGTENAIMAATLARGTTTIFNAACEPHVQDLCVLLNRMGAKISGVGSNLLTIVGQKRLGGAEFRIGFDFMEAVSYLSLSAITGGELEISNIIPQQLRMSLLTYQKMGITWEYAGDTLYLRDNQKLSIHKDIGDTMPVIADAPWPGFPPDVASIAIVTATQCRGVVMVHEKLFESRLFFVDKLIAMGANIVLCDPHRVVINGGAQLRGTTLVSPDVRAGMALVIAALCAQGESLIANVYQVERGYADLVQKMQSLGADIERIESPQS